MTSEVEIWLPLSNYFSLDSIVAVVIGCSTVLSFLAAASRLSS